MKMKIEQFNWAEILPMIQSYAHRLTGSVHDAEDAAQRAALNIMRFADKAPNDPSKHDAWARRVARNAMIDEIRARNKALDDPRIDRTAIRVSEPESVDLFEVDGVAHTEERALGALQDALDTLTPKERAMLFAGGSHNKLRNYKLRARLRARVRRALAR